jgi:hypothetical protein
MNPSTRLRAALLLVSGVVVLTACSAASPSDKTVSTPHAAGGSSAAFDSAVGDGGGAGEKAAPVADTAIQRSVIATGMLRVASRHPDRARGDALALVTGIGGNVANEQSSSDKSGRLDQVDLTLRVPAAKFEQALDDLAKLGTLRQREQSAEDVTTQVIDIDAKVKAQRASVESIQRLLARANTIAEIMSIESQLSSRQGELDSLVQQQKYLADQTSMSTIQLQLVRRTSAGTDHTGFLGGLSSGWKALGDSTVAAGTALGAMLPFAALLVLIGVPVWFSARRIRARARSAA